MFKKLSQNEHFQKVKEFLQSKNLDRNSFLVGGTVRDVLLNRELKDLDFAINADALNLAREFAKYINGTYVLLDEVFQIGRVVKEQVTIDFSRLSGDTIEDDLKERDFTINAMATDLELKKLIDPFNGLQDLNEKKIRMVKEKNLKADPLRILRAYRFHATLGFEIEEKTREAMKKHAHLMKLTAKERIKEELWKILSVADSARTAELMIEDEIFKVIFTSPEHLLFKPNINALKLMEEVLKSPKKVFDYYKPLQGKNIIQCMKFAAIFGIHALSMIKQIKPSRKEERFIENLLKAADKLKKIETLLDKVSFLRSYESILYPALIYGISIDPIGLARAWFYKDLEHFYKKTYSKNKKKLPVIKGEDILALGFEPSPLVGQLIERIEILTLAGRISNKEEAMRELKKYLTLTRPTTTEEFKEKF
ncbi:tRNA nucleotidyltransferase/poly(A) polymerase family protein [Thermodesulfovibrio hydrogeniphilus]